MTVIEPHAARAAASAIEPVERVSPAEFATRYRKLHPIYCTERPGPWSNAVFPFQSHLMNMVEEAMRSGKRGVVYMKAGQIGGTDVGINGGMFLKTYYPGPMLFMTSTEYTAAEFGRERWGPIIEDCEPLRRRYIATRYGDIMVKRFVDGKLEMAGGQSVFKLQSTPFRFVLLDELDSLVENLGGEGDPVRLAEVRTASFTGPTLIMAWAHPTTKDRGVGKLFYQHSDQRRAFITHGCGCEFGVDFTHVKCGSGLDEKEAHNWHYHCPGCNAIIDDVERGRLLASLKYKSLLPPEEAAKKPWIGAQFGQLLNPAKSVRSLVQSWLECAGDDNATRVFINKVLGETYEPKVQTVKADELRALIVVKRRADDPEFYTRGTVPPWVLFLTAGQDSRTVELHYAIWGWGLRRGIDGQTRMCGALIDWDVIKREYSLVFSDAEFHVFDDLIYRRSFPCSAAGRIFQVRLCAHDIGYAPTRIPIIRYCRNFPNRAAPATGAALTATESSKAPYAQMGQALKFRSGENVVEDATSRQLLFNTFLLKNELFGNMKRDRRFEINDAGFGARKVGFLSMPEDVDDAYLRQSSNEELVTGDKGELVWKKTGPNHYSDCNCYAFGCAMYLSMFAQNTVVGEAAPVRRQFVAPVINERGGRDYDPAAS